MKEPKRYHHDLLTRRRWYIHDKERADRSLFQWSTTKYGYALSLLGIINGIIQHLPFQPVLAVEVEPGNDEIIRYSISRKWW